MGLGLSCYSLGKGRRGLRWGYCKMDMVEWEQMSMSDGKSVIAWWLLHMVDSNVSWMTMRVLVVVGVLF